MIRETLTMIPGPTPVHDTILDELRRPTVSHQDPDFVRDYAQCLERIRSIVQGDLALPFVVGGAGTLGMEMALVNLLGPRERLLVVSHGYFGNRYAEIATAFGIEHEVLASEWGRAVSVDELESRLSAGEFHAVAFSHVDTSTGVAAPVEAFAKAIRSAGALTILDGVCATAGMEERFDDWRLDALLTGAQKALGAPPGVGVLVVSQSAMEKRRSLAAVPAYYADLLRWEPIMKNPALYFSTPPVNEIRALNVAAGMILDEGLHNRFDRHRRMASAMRAGLQAIGMGLFTDPGCLADTLSLPLYPSDIDDAAFRKGMADRGVIVAGSLGPVAGKAFRVGHMGNIGTGEIARTLEAIEATVAGLRGSKSNGSAVAAAAPLL